MALTQITSDVVTGNVLASATNAYFANTQNGGVIPGNFITPYTLPNTAIANSSITSAQISSVANTQITGTVTNNINTGSLVTGGVSLGAGNASIMKNRIINGEFKISQYKGATATTGVTNPVSYYIDRFVNYCSSGSVFSLGQNLGGVTPPAGFAYYFGMQNTTASTSSSGQYCNMQHYIEGYNIADLAWGTANAKTITMSFWVYSNVTGTYGLALQNGGSSYGYPTTYTISTANTWTYVTVTIPGPTSGTWTSDNSRGITIVWDLGQGSSFRFTAGSWQSANVQGTTGAVNWNQTTNATFYITGVQLEVGSSATGYEYRQYQQELALCQRYFAAIYVNDYFAAGFSPNSTTGRTTGIYYPVTLRTSSPTITFPASGQGAGQVSFTTNIGAYPSTTGTTAVAYATNTMFTIVGASYVGLSSSGNSQIYSNGPSTIQVSAEL